MTKMLCIFDGLGLVPQAPSNAPSNANMPTFRRVLSQYPWITLHADGQSVGQEAGLVGNSEVGHTNIGGLKLVKQLSLQITESAEKHYQELSEDQLFDPAKLLQKKFTGESQTLHLIGLFSTASVHSDLRHWIGAIQAGLRAGAEKIVLHLISDGRDSDRESLVSTWEVFVKELENLDVLDSPELPLTRGPHELASGVNARGLGGKGGGEKIFLGSLGGRFYLMDRDKNYGRNWEGLQVTLHPSLIHPAGDKIQNYFQNQWQTEVELNDPQPEFARTDLSEGKDNLQTVSQKSYETNNYDETIEPLSLSESDLIATGDTVWIVNFRTDRVRQMTQILVYLNRQLNWRLTILGTNDFGAEREQYLSSNLDNFDPEGQAHYYPIFKPQPVQGTLAETISKMGKTQLHIAETEKYNHVTYFLNGGQDVKHEGEEHQLIPSNKVKSHAEKPEMKTKEVTDYILENYQNFDYIVVNFACPDMVGHTGDVSASLRTLEFLDEQFGRILEKVENGEIDMVLIADHGNIEVVGEVEVDGEKYIDTAHNPNPVPCVFLKKDFKMDQFYESLIQAKERHNLPLDVELIKSAVAQRPDVNLIGKNDWLTQQEIPKPQVPLWYSGVFLLAI